MKKPRRQRRRRSRALADHDITWWGWEFITKHLIC